MLPRTVATLVTLEQSLSEVNTTKTSNNIITILLPQEIYDKINEILNLSDSVIYRGIISNFITYLAGYVLLIIKKKMCLVLPVATKKQALYWI